MTINIMLGILCFCILIQMAVILSLNGRVNKLDPKYENHDEISQEEFDTMYAQLESLVEQINKNFDAHSNALEAANKCLVELSERLNKLENIDGEEYEQ